MNVSETGLLINKRFFHTIEVLKQMHILGGPHGFARKYGINVGNIYTIKKEPDKHFVNAEWLSFLVTDFDVSAEYLLTGKGNMFNKCVKEIISKLK